MWFQSPEYLAWSRKQLLSKQNIAIIVDKLGLTEKSRIVDVGCGSGELTRRLHEAVGCSCIGVDIDLTLIAYAKQFENEKLSFLQADALDIPLGDSCADVVISHTFLTNIFDAESALLEMRRICTEGGQIAAINAETFEYIPNYGDGLAAYPWFAELYQYRLKAHQCFMKEAGRYLNGLVPEAIPQFFADNGLNGVQVFQLGKLYSAVGLDGCGLDREAVEMEYRTDCSMAEWLEDGERERCRALAAEKRKALLSGHKCMDWTGGSNLLVTARNAKADAAVAAVREKYGEIERLGNALKAGAADTEIEVCRAGVEAVASVRISNGWGISAVGSGLTPCDALLAAHRKFLTELVFQPSACAADAKSLTSELLSDWMDEAELPGVETEYSSLLDGTKVSLNSEVLKWCFPKRCTAAAVTFDEAMTEALYDALAVYAFKRLLEEKHTPIGIPMGELADSWILKCVQLLGRYGYQLRLLDISCGSGIPAVALCVFNEKGAVTKYAADYDLTNAVKKCVLKLFENRKIKSLIGAAAPPVAQYLSDAMLFNLVGSGEGSVPECFLTSAERPEHSWFALPKNVPEALRALCTELNLHPCFRRDAAEGLALAEIVLPDQQMLWPFAKKRISECLLLRELRRVTADFVAASAAEIKVLGSYMESKRAWNGENTAFFLSGAAFHVPALNMPLDFNLLLAACYITGKEYEKAARSIVPHTPVLNCLRQILSGVSTAALEQIFSAELVSRAQRFIDKPFDLIREDR